ncbi:hypothetical protein F5H01DRAFT_339156 [Linnemannia elongata]|nr:hypothetical protein F5H01DRAFT_339156 [Linnemannia elongata]
MLCALACHGGKLKRRTACTCVLCVPFAFFFVLEFRSIVFTCYTTKTHYKTQFFPLRHPRLFFRSHTGGRLFALLPGGLSTQHFRLVQLTTPQCPFSALIPSSSLSYPCFVLVTLCHCALLALCPATQTSEPRSLFISILCSSILQRFGGLLENCEGIVV